MLLNFFPTIWFSCNLYVYNIKIRTFWFISYFKFFRSLDSGHGSFTDDGIYIERRSTASSNSSGFNSVTDEQVPDAFTYKAPTKEELENSKPIPPYIVSWNTEIYYSNFQLETLKLISFV